MPYRAPSAGAWIATICIAGLLPAAQEAPIFRSEVALTRVKVAVLDSAGNPVEGLGPEDFAVQERGQAREVKLVLSPDDNALDVALVLDFSQSVAERWPEARDAARDLLKSFSSRDCVYLLPFNERVGPGVWASANDSELEVAVEEFPFGGRTRLYDALNQAQTAIQGRVDPTGGGVSEHCRSVQGEGARERRQAIVLLTDGEDQASHATYADALVTSWYGEVPVFAVAVGSAAERKGQSLRDQLAEIARVTGGQLLSQAEVRDGYRRILSLLRGYYVIGYASGAEVADGWSAVEVEVPRERYEVLTQRGVFRVATSVQPAIEALARGRANYQSGAYERALEAFSLAARLNPAVGSPLFGRGVALEALGRWAEARDSYRAALASEPGLSAAHVRLAERTMQQRDFDAAWEHLVRARLAGMDVGGLMAALAARSEPPFDLEQRLDVPLIGVLEPASPRLEIQLGVQPVLNRIIRTVDQSSHYAFTPSRDLANFFVVPEVERFEPLHDGRVSARLRMRLQTRDGRSLNDVRVEIELPGDAASLPRVLDDEIETLLRWVTDNVRGRR